MIKAQDSVYDKEAMASAKELRAGVKHTYRYNAPVSTAMTALDPLMPVSRLGVQLNLLEEEKAVDKELKLLKAQHTAIEKKAKRRAPIIQPSSKFTLLETSKPVKRRIEAIEIEESRKKRRVEPAQETTPLATPPAQNATPPPAETTPPATPPTTPPVQEATPPQAETTPPATPSSTNQAVDSTEPAENEAEPMAEVEVEDQIMSTEEDEDADAEGEEEDPMVVEEAASSSDYGDGDFDYSQVDLTNIV